MDLGKGEAAKTMTRVDSTGSDHSGRREGRRRQRGSACDSDGAPMALKGLGAAETGEEMMGNTLGGARRPRKDEGDRW